MADLVAGKAPGPARVVAVVQARLGSSRLPGKVLLKAGGRTLLGHVIERLQAAETVDQIVVATTDDPADDAVVQQAIADGVDAFAGSRDDVLARFVGAIAGRDADVVVRVTADCPLLDPAEIDRVVGGFIARWPTLDYASNQLSNRRRGPLGMAVEVMKAAALRTASERAKAAHQREHVTPYLYDPASKMRVECFDFPVNLAHLRLTVDTPADFDVVSTVLDGIQGAPDRMSLQAALRVLAEQPDLAARNRDIRQKSAMEAATKHLLLRADATVDGGTGHVMRLLGIGQAWMEQGGAATLLSHRLPPALGDRLLGAGIALQALPDDCVPGSIDDAEIGRKVANDLLANVALVDGYAFDTGFLRALGGGGLPVAYIDDWSTETLPVAAVILPNLGQMPAPKNRSVGEPVTLFGAEHIPVRTDFRVAPRPDRRFDHRPLRLLLTFGGSDPARMSVRALRAAIKVSDTIPLAVTVLLGPVHPDVEQVKQLAEHAQRSAKPCTIEVLHDVRDMPGLLARIDLALSAGGTTCWELATLGIPMLLCPVADNQNIVLSGLGGADAAWILRPSSELDDDALTAGLLEFVGAGPAVHATLSQTARRLIDGQGAVRIARRLADLALAAAA